MEGQEHLQKYPAAQQSESNSFLPKRESDRNFGVQSPSISLPKGGGAIRNIDEKFSVNAVNGTSALTIPLPFSSARGYSPSLSLNYNSGSGNGIAGLGWQMHIASIKRRTDKQIPQYIDDNDTDTFLISDAEDLVPEFKKDSSDNFIRLPDGSYVINEFSSPDDLYLIRRYKPRTEGLFARIERWLEKNTGLIHWRVISRENNTTIYGKSASARIADPRQPLHIFEWFIEFTYDDKGNCALYEYKPEDAQGIGFSDLHNRNRTNGNTLFTNTYLKRIRYGNITMYKHHEDPVPMDFMFETVFDYGEYNTAVPFSEVNTWEFRTDAFSDYRSGFEIRNCRLCKKVLLYHHFTELPGGSALVKATHLVYDNNGADGLTFLKQIITTGYTKHDDSSYTEKSLPPLSFEYSKHQWNEEIQSVATENLVHAPSGLDEPVYQFTDLYNEGLNGILTELSGGWFYKSNWGNAHFTEGREVVSKPSYRGLSNGSLQLNDLEGNGIKQLVNWNDAVPGFFELDTEAKWQPYETFKKVPNINFKDPNLKFIDLNGDGLADILLTEENVFAWYPSKGKEGFGDAIKTFKFFDEEKGPAVVFADPTQTIFLSNMSGGGLSDIVRIRNGEVCYWPNLGYGAFGAKVSMDNAPLFDHEEKFNPALIKLADIDGSGTTDLIYLGRNNVKIWFNRQGNRFAAEPKIIDSLPEINQQSKITVTDLLATGLSCIVWSNSLPKNQGSSLRYIDLMKSVKPHILISYCNNLGKEVALEYKPSTQYYIEDEMAGTPWVTKLHFPVHCVSKVITCDRIMKTRFASEYAYHHGYYDHFEKEFRGFGRVDQKDAEDITHFIMQSAGASNNVVDTSLHQYPVLTKTWFHTGAFLDREKILNQFAHEYFSNSGVPEKKLPEPELSQDLTTDEWRQALRACKSTILRKEIYALDQSLLEKTPYTAEQHNILIKKIQPAGQQKFAVFLTHESESIIYHYERNADDPRVINDFVLETDPYGNVLQSASVVYKRNPPLSGNPPNEPEQEEVRISLTEIAYTNDIQLSMDYRSRMPYEKRSYELGGFPLFSGYLDITNLRTQCSAATAINYDALFTGPLQKRIIKYTRTQYRADDSITVLPFGTIESKGLTHQAYKAAFNQDMLTAIFGAKITPIALAATLTNPLKGGYIFSDNYYWISSGSRQYDTNHFFLTTAVTDPFGNTTIAQYDTGYSLFLQKSIDAAGNTVQVKEILPGKPAFNYRTLSPYIMQDINLNETAVRFDELGMTIKSFVIGKKGTDKGDEIDETKVETNGAQDHATVEINYSLPEWYNQVTAPGFDINNYKPQPPYVKTRSRETHYHADPAHITNWLETYSYSDGGGHEVLKKSQAEPGTALQVQADGTIITIDTALLNPVQLRWIGNGRTVLNNKGNPVLKYEPYFSTQPHFDDEKEMVQLGVTSVTEYDPLNRIIKTKNPDNTFTKISFTGWKELHYDANDTVIDSDWYIERGSPNPAGPEPANAETRAAWHSAGHYDTPEVKHLDNAGRTFLVIADNKTETLASRIRFDIEGNERKIYDATGREVMAYDYDMLGNKLQQISMDAGTRWMIKDAIDKPLLSWNERGFHFIFEYDEARRPVRSFLQKGTTALVLFEIYEYGKPTVPAHLLNNLVGKITKHYDQAGIITNIQYDFKGNLLESARRFTVNYETEIDWTDISLVATKPESYFSNTQYNANNKPVKITSPYLPMEPRTEIFPSYNEGNLLEKIAVSVKGAAKEFIVENINYNAKGQRLDVFYGNKTKTRYNYNKNTHRLERLLTSGNTGSNIRQDISYTYDAVGNAVEIHDAAQAVITFDGEQVNPVNKYRYNAIYQLQYAEGRKQAGQTDINHSAPGFNYRNHPFVNSATINPNDAQAFRNYHEEYAYDSAGNMLEQKHIAKNSSWTRTFDYNPVNNRLAQTGLGSFVFKYIDAAAGRDYDAHGNMCAMEHIQELIWNFKDELSEAHLGGGGKAYYVYDSEGQRVRKVIERLDGTKEERIYLGITEILFKTDTTGSPTLQRESIHIMDDKKRVAIIEIPVVKPAGSTEQQLTRYQYDNYLGSACYELDQAADLISYEEYFPFGTTSYSVTDNSREISAKRYRFTAKERDEETGLNYHGARFYAPWLCRWISTDPAGLVDGNNMYLYVGNHPTNTNDPTGMWEMPSWRTVAVVAAVVVVGTVVTVATAGAAGPLVVGAVASIGLTGTAATVATGVVVGAVAGAAGGFAGGVAGEATRQTVNHSALGLGTESYDGGRILSEGGRGAATGAAIGAAVGGVAAFATTTAGAAAIGAVGRVAQRTAPTLSRVVVSGARATATAARAVGRAPVISHAGRALQALETGGHNLGVRAAQGVFSQGSTGAAAVARYAATRSVAATFEPPPPAPTPPPTVTPATTWQQHEGQVTQAIDNSLPAGTTHGQQITLDVTNTATGELETIRIDNIFRDPATTNFQLVDAKFSSVRNLTTGNLSSTVTESQEAVYGWIRNGDPVSVVPRGARAVAAGLPTGPIPINPAVQVHVNSPSGIVIRNY